VQESKLKSKTKTTEVEALAAEIWKGTCGTSAPTIRGDAQPSIQAERHRWRRQFRRQIFFFLSGGIAGEIEELIAVEVLIVLEHALDGMQRRAHHRNHGLHRVFACDEEFVVKRFDGGLMSDGHQGGV